VAEMRPGTPEQTAFLLALLDEGHFVATGVPGVYGRGEVFETIRHAVDSRVTRAGAGDEPRRWAFPPVLSREHFETSGYLKSFPHLAGSVFSFEGDEKEARDQHELASRHEQWSGHQTMSELVLTPAACYAVYPAIAAEGPLDPGGATVDAGGSYVFRHEPSGDPARLQMFHQREIVRIGEPETVATWRDTWRDRAIALLRDMQLEADADVASDPFFGRTGRMLSRSQREQALKFEVLVPIAGPEPTAVASFNYHQEHFTERFGITMADGSVAHTACLGFGLERITLALLHAHGLALSDWPAEARQALEL
jgi:seryl-tRNA synthetase